MSEKINRRKLLSHGACLAAGGVLGYLGTQFASRPWTPRAAAERADETPEQRLKRLKIVLPEVSAPKTAILAPAVRVGNTLYVSGNGPGSKDGKPIKGKLGKDFSLEDGQDAARRVGLTILAVARAELGSLDKVVRLVKTLGMVNCTPDFTQQPAVINGFSKLMVEVFGEKAGKGARSAVGMASLPNGIPVEIECIFQIEA